MTADLDYLAELFEPVGGVRIRRMFGGLGFFRDGLMFGIWQDDTIYLKADDATRPAFEAEGCGPFVYGSKNGRETSLSYFRMPERLLDDTDELRDWALKAIDVAIRANARKPSGKKR
ncbi:TfoX/Sxy family protein [Kaistia nematophila]|uniref:TfoX/Sxy family protein n=1 Tax=Kaistia nematophila TaxID=2994654 RepID=A0A9X3E3S5_9HYPH|nr:TfoX/Sxy family protein [Kaistia nematophila]MCX5571004.1 TfoX/Sxy family protein [Kaistia nematophila]